MKLVGKVSVEPLDDERLTNIERNLVVHVSEMSQRPLRAPRRLLAFAGVAMAVVVAGFIGWKVRGDGTVEVGPKSEQYAMKGGALELGDAQITGKDFTVTRSKDRVEVVMAPGKLELHVEHKPGRLFVVRAGDVEIEDVGTRFAVAFDGKHVDVRVSEGEVKVKHAGKELSIKAGSAWDIDIGPITIAALDEKQQAAVVAQAQTQPQAQVPNPVDVVGAAGTGSGGGSGAVRSGSNAKSGNGSAAGSGSGSGSSARKPGVANARKALEKAPLDPPADAGTDDPKAAISKYLADVKVMPEGEDKAQMLYSIAFMQHRGKQDTAALYTISGVLKRQGGPAYKAALWLNVRIRCLKAFDDDCRIASAKYLSKFEQGVHAGVAQEILKEISRGQ